VGARRFFASRSWQRLKLTGCVAFCLLHLTAVLVRGLPPAARDLVWPAFAWYGDGLRMTNTWGMFSLPPKTEQVNVVGVTRAGESVELSRVQQATKQLLDRVTDVRLRKIQNRLREKEVRDHWGKDYLRYFCRQHPELSRVSLVLEAPSQAPQVLLRVGCRSLEAKP
jgi:hypothetical protein